MLPAEHLRKVAAWARERGTIVASDECYLGFGWDATPVSVLHPDACDGSHQGLLAVHSLSKRSNLAGYRAGFVTGDPQLVRELLEIRKHAGLLMPAPVQAAMAAALGDDEHAERAAGQVRGAARAAPARAGGGGLGRAAFRGRAVPVGGPSGARLLGLGARARRRRASWSPPASFTGRPGTGTSGWR